MKLKRLDLTTLSMRTGIEVGRLQRCLEKGLVPDRTWLLQADDESQLAGIDELTGTFLVCAVLLLDAGYAERSISSLLTTVSLVMKPGRNPLNLPVAADIVSNATNVVVQIADRDHVRWRVDRRDTSWIRIRAGKREPVVDYVPKIITAIDMSGIRERVLSQ